MQTLIHKFGDVTVAITGPTAALGAFQQNGPGLGKAGEHRLTAAEVGEMLGCSRQLVHYKAKRGLIPAPTKSATGRPFWNAALVSAFVAAIGGTR